MRVAYRRDAEAAEKTARPVMRKPGSLKDRKSERLKKADATLS
jgi:hypothetical protein